MSYTRLAEHELGSVQLLLSSSGCQVAEVITDAAAYRLPQACSICYVLGDPANLKAGAVVQPVVWPVVEGSEVNVGGHVVSKKVLPFIVCPPEGKLSVMHCCMRIIMWDLDETERGREAELMWLTWPTSLVACGSALAILP